MKETVRSRPGAARRKFKAMKKARTTFPTHWLRDFEAKQDERGEAMDGAHGCHVAGTRYAVERSKPVMVEPGEQFPRQWRSQPKGDK